MGNYTKYNVQAPIRWTEKWTNVGRVELLIENNQGLFEQYRTVESLSKSHLQECDENKFISLKKKKKMGVREGTETLLQ